MLPTLGCLRGTIPALTRGAPHRCSVRHGVSRLPRDGEKASKRRRFAEAAIGHAHIDACEPRLAEGKPFMSLAIGRVTKLAHVGFLDADTEMNGAAFLREVVAAFPCRIHAVPTDDGMAFADPPKCRGGPTARRMGRIFDRVRRGHGIEHRLTKPCHPWTTDEVEKSLWRDPVLLSPRPRATAWQRAGREVRARPRSLQGRSSLAAPVGALGPRRVQPSVWRR
jgi:hypothetical protein